MDDVLDFLRASAGRGSDQSGVGYSAVTLLEQVHALGVRHVRLSDGLVWHGGLQLPTTAIEAPLFASWSSGDDHLCEGSAPAGAYVEPIDEGYFRKAVSVIFVGSVNGVVAPLAGKVIVDLAGAGMTRVDQLRVAAGVTPACDATLAELADMDTSVSRLGELGRYRVRTPPDEYTVPVAPTHMRPSRQWQSWAEDGLRDALSSTCVDLDPEEPMLSAYVDADERTNAERSFNFVVRFGPAAALHLLGVLQQQARLN